MQAFLKNKALIIKAFRFVELALVATWIIGSIFFLRDPSLLPTIYEYGLEFGKYALVFYCLSLVPGILQRFGFLSQLRVVLMLFRRHFGIMMFLFVWLHMSWSTMLPLIGLSGLSLEAFSFFSYSQWFGLSAVLLLLPMFLTSNDFSVRKLGPYWKKIHKLTYIILFLIFLHVALIESTWLVVIVPTMLAWIFSWITFFSRKVSQRQPPTNPVIE